MARYLLDTNHLMPAIYPVSRLRERLHQARRAGHKIGTCIPALCELEIGIQHSNNPNTSRRQLRHLLGSARIWPLDQEVARLYAEIYQRLRQSGRAMSQVDIMLAALAKRMNLTLLTTDQDFTALPEIRTENWLT